MKTTATFTDPFGDENIKTRGITTSVILSTDRGSGKLTIMEQKVEIGIASAQLICNREDKALYIAEGKFMLLAAGYKYIVDKGVSMFIPRGVMHRFKNIGTNTGKLLVTLTPARQENPLKDVAQTVKVFGQDMGIIKNAATKYGVEII